MNESQPSAGPASPADEDLWGAYVSGSDEALRELIARHREALYWYLLLSTGKESEAAQAVQRAWGLVAAYRRPFAGFASFKSWLYAVATQSSVPATHPDQFGLADMLDDFKRPASEARRTRLFFRLADMARAVRQPFLLVTIAGLSVGEAAKACNFTERRAFRCIEKAYRRLARDELFRSAEAADEV
jgi:DNA-directed RNA polymerase specialized sigma24 family protein